MLVSLSSGVTSYQEAADHFTAAMAREPATDQAQRRDYMDLQAETLHRQGGVQDGTGLRRAVEAFEAALLERTRERAQLAWVMPRGASGTRRAGR